MQYRDELLSRTGGKAEQYKLVLFVLAFIDRSAEDMTGNRGETRSKGTQAGSRTPVRCRASAHGTHAVPTEISFAIWTIFYIMIKLISYPDNNIYIPACL